MKIEAPENPNYCAIVTTLQTFVELPGCDRIKAAVVYGTQVIVSKDAKPGDVGLYFPPETALSAEFCSENNLFVKPEYGNMDPTKKGFFEKHGRVKCVKFRGFKSEGFWIPLSSLGYLLSGIDFKEGDSFDKIDDHEICCKLLDNLHFMSRPRTSWSKASSASTPTPSSYAVTWICSCRTRSSLSATSGTARPS